MNFTPKISVFDRVIKILQGHFYGKLRLELEREVCFQADLYVVSMICSADQDRGWVASVRVFADDEVTTEQLAAEIGAILIRDMDNAIRKDERHEYNTQLRPPSTIDRQTTC